MPLAPQGPSVLFCSNKRTVTHVSRRTCVGRDDEIPGRVGHGCRRVAAGGRFRDGAASGQPADRQSRSAGGWPADRRQRRSRPGVLRAMPQRAPAARQHVARGVRCGRPRRQRASRREDDPQAACGNDAAAGSGKAAGRRGCRLRPGVGREAGRGRLAQPEPGTPLLPAPEPRRVFGRDPRASRDRDRGFGVPPRRNDERGLRQHRRCAEPVRDAARIVPDGRQRGEPARPGRRQRDPVGGHLRGVALRGAA